MPTDEKEIHGEAISLRDCIYQYGDPEALATLERLGQEIGEDHVERVLSGKPVSHWEARALLQRGHDLQAIRSAVIDPIIEQFASRALLCSGFDAARPKGKHRISILADRIGEWTFDFAASEATAGAERLTNVVVKASKRRVTWKHVTDKVFQAWYQERCDRFIAAGKKSTRKQDIDDAKAKFGDRVTDKMVREARKKIAPQRWSKPGPNTKKPDAEADGNASSG